MVLRQVSNGLRFSPKQARKGNRVAKRSAWQLPPGVSSGSWDYFQSESVAADYDTYFGAHPLFQLDGQWVQQWVGEGERVVDFGCGTGRSLLPLARRGDPVLGVDLSLAMLSQLRRKAEAESLSVWLLRANLVELQALADASFDVGLCLFSTLGMVRGGAQRQQAMRHFARILRPGGRLLLHVHNVWDHLWVPGGRRTLAMALGKSLFARDWQFGDRIYPYRGVQQMYLHTFRWSEIRRLVDSTGFQLLDQVPLNATFSGPLRLPWLASPLRCSGWLLTLRRR